MANVNLPIDTLAFPGFHQFLAEAYPLIHSGLKKEVFSEFSLLYTWEGKNPGIKPVILMAHMDVVSAVETDAWAKPPFSGENDGTFIWGRGTLDDKGPMVAILDEGLPITKGIVPMITIPVASIGISEKGYLSVTLTMEMEGGHSSTPEKESAITVLNNALYNIINKQMKAGIAGPVKEFLRYTGPEMPFLPRIVFANQWLFKGLILKIYEGSKAGNASVRTTTSPTIIHAGVKDNMIPTKAEAVVNFRIIPGKTSGDVMKHLGEVISDDRVKITVLGEIENNCLVQSLFGIIKSKLPRQLKSLVGYSATEFINTIKINYATKMFDNGCVRINEAMEAIGLTSYSYFNKLESIKIVICKKECLILLSSNKM